MGKLNVKHLLISGLVLCLLFVAAPQGNTEEITFQPAGLERTLFSKRFQPLTIKGTAPEGSQIILKIVSPIKDFKLNKSGKGLGFVWLPISHTEVKKLPGLFALLSSAKISQLLSLEHESG